MIYFFITYLVAITGYFIFTKTSRKRNFGQTEREEGLRSHKRKNGTVTSGGIIFVTIGLALLFITMGFGYKTFFFMTPFLAYFLIGLLDDLTIVKKKSNEGLSKRLRLILEIVSAGITFFFYLSFDKSTELNLYFTKIELHFVYGLLLLFMFVASGNAYNLTDGVDGLLSSISIVMLAGFLVISYKDNEPKLFLFILSFMASILAFYFYNYPNAYLFMGDCGSLAIGAILCAISIYLHIELLYVIMSIIPIWETLSVIIQVSVFKLTHGKRVFKMAPFHHHLEILGYSEKAIDSIFILIEVALVIISLYIGGYL